MCRVWHPAAEGRARTSFRLPAVLRAQAIQEGHRRVSQGADVSVSKLLDRLDGVGETGPGRWIARCPAHEDRRPSLSVRELGDGTVLIKCFPGCGAADVVTAVGLDLRDLFPQRTGDHRRRPSHARISAADALATLDHEAHVVAIIGADLLEHRDIDQPTWDRLAQAVHRIGETRAQVVPAKHKVTA